MEAGSTLLECNIAIKLIADNLDHLLGKILVLRVLAIPEYTNHRPDDAGFKPAFDIVIGVEPKKLLHERAVPDVECSSMIPFSCITIIRSFNSRMSEI